MPNWCSSHLEIFGPAEAVARLREAVASNESPFDFERVLPTPEALIEKKEPPAGEIFPEWYGWRLANWGTKWNANGPEIDELPAPSGRACLRYRFMTAWSPPVPLIEHLVAGYPELGFGLFYSDEMLNFVGHARWANGRYITGESVDDEEEQNRLGNQVFRDRAETPREPLTAPLICEPAPRWELLLDRERVFFAERGGVPTTRIRIARDRSAQRLVDGQWVDETLPGPLTQRLALLERSGRHANLLPLDVELLEVAHDGAPGRAPLPGDGCTRLLLDLHLLGDEPLDTRSYAERRQLRAELAQRLVGREGSVWFDLADPRLAAWHDRTDRPVMGDQLETSLLGGLAAARRWGTPEA